MKSNPYLGRKMPLSIMFIEMFIVNQIALAGASPDTIVKVEPYASTALVGETFTVNITLTDVQNLYGLEIALQWNASVLKIISWDDRLGIESNPDGVLHEPIFLAKNETLPEQGRYVLAASSTAPAASFNGSGSIVRITFNVTNRGNTKLKLETKLADKPQTGDVASPIVHITTSGIFSPIHIFTSSATVNVGENVNISGFIALAQANVDVTVQYRREDETSWHTLPPVKTNEKGNYQRIWQPSERGKYEIIATAFIDNIKETSYSVYLTVKAPNYIPVWQFITPVLLILVVGIIAIAIYYRSIRKQKTMRN